MKTMSREHKKWITTVSKQLDEQGKIIAELVDMAKTLHSRIITLEQKFAGPSIRTEKLDEKPLVETDPAKINLAMAIPHETS